MTAGAVAPVRADLPADAMLADPPAGDSGPSVEATVVEPELFVAEAFQWLSTSTGRLAGDGYSWLQAVHWVAGSGLYRPRRHRQDGPAGFSRSTLLIAQELAGFVQCRPGIDLLMRRTGLKKRMVEYHLQMLREAGLLVWIAKGTRVRGGKGMASEFGLVIPPAFDRALGIRTVQRHAGAPEYTRAVAGICEAGRTLMAGLGKKAARKVRRPRRKPAVKRSAQALLPASVAATARVEHRVQESAQGPDSAVGRGDRCTPLGGGTSAVSTAGSTPLPSEDERASGQSTSLPPRTSSRRTGRGRAARRLNSVGRRFALARELMQRVPWLRSADRARIAWVVGEVCDAGWTVEEVLACLDLRQEPPGGVRRASGFLAARMRGMTTMPGWTTKQQRQVQVDHRTAAVDAARRERITQIRDRQERTEAAWQPPRDAAARREVDQDLSRVLAPKPRIAADAPGLPELAGPHELTAAERAQQRRAAAAELMAGETTLIGTAVDCWGAAAAERIYGAALMHRARQLAGLTSLARFGIDREQP
jgi:hypothetical protein